MTLKSAMPAEDWLILHNKYFYVLPQHLLGDIPVEDLMAADLGMMQVEEATPMPWRDCSIRSSLSTAKAMA